MRQERKQIEAWLEGRTNRASESEAIEAILSIADACDTVIESGNLSVKNRQTIADGLSHIHSMVWGNTVDLVITLQKWGIDVSGILLDLITSKEANARLAAISCLRGELTPHLVMDEMLIAGLTDKSAKVCERAAEIATITFRKKWLAPVMAQAAKKYKNVAHYRQLLQHGYIFGRLADGNYELEVLTDGSGVWGNSFSKTELNAKGVKFRSTGVLTVSEIDALTDKEVSIKPAEEERRRA